MTSVPRRVARLLAPLALGAALVGCSAAAESASPATSVSPQTMLAAHDLSGLTAEQVVERLDADPRARPLPLRGSVRPSEVILSDGKTETTLPIGEKFYLSIAPYVKDTHNCFNHNVGTCKGEMAKQTVRVTITSGSETLVDKDVETYANGFVGFWLPRNIEGTVTVTADGKKGSVPFATRADSATCLTTLKLV